MADSVEGPGGPQCHSGGNNEMGPVLNGSLRWEVGGEFRPNISGGGR